MGFSIKCSGITQLDNKVKAYVADMGNKMQQIVTETAEVGKKEAEANCGQWKSEITVSVDNINTTPSKSSCELSCGSGEIDRVWYADKKLTIERSYPVSPLYLAEFGSGWLAENQTDLGGFGQGTMPNSMGHASDDDGWYWYDANGVKHHSIGEPPSFPVHSADVAMMSSASKIARRVLK